MPILKSGVISVQIKDILSKVTGFLKRNRLVSLFIFVHSIFVVLLGRLYTLAPDEGGYLYTFNNLHGSKLDANPQYQSGWITAPKPC